MHHQDSLLLFPGPDDFWLQGPGSEQAAFGQCCCMRESVVKAGCFRGLNLTHAAPLVLSILPSQDSKNGGVLDAGDAPWHALLGQCGHNLSPEG